MAAIVPDPSSSSLCTADLLLIKPPAPLFPPFPSFFIYSFQKVVADNSPPAVSIRRHDLSSLARRSSMRCFLDWEKPRTHCFANIDCEPFVHSKKKFSPSIVVYLVALRACYRARQSRGYSSIRSFKTDPRGVISNRMWIALAVSEIDFRQNNGSYSMKT